MVVRWSAAVRRVAAVAMASPSSRMSGAWRCRGRGWGRSRSAWSRLRSVWDAGGGVCRTVCVGGFYSRAPRAWLRAGLLPVGVACAGHPVGESWSVEGRLGRVERSGGIVTILGARW